MGLTPATRLKGGGGVRGGTWSPLWTWGPVGGRGAQKWENL